MEFTPEIKNRLKRVEGQIRGVYKMMDDEKECKEVISQMSAARTAIDRAIATTVAQNLEQCVREQSEQGEDTSEVVQNAIQLLVKSR